MGKEVLAPGVVIGKDLAFWAAALRFAGSLATRQRFLPGLKEIQGTYCARWEPMFKAQEILNQDRPVITLAGENSIQAYRNDKFEFPKDTCDVGLGMMDPISVLNATVKP